MKNKIKITHEDIRKEVINRQKKFGKGDPDICCNKIFNGVTYKYMIVLINHWPKCDECNSYAELEFEYYDEAEIPITLLYIAASMLED